MKMRVHRRRQLHKTVFSFSFRTLGVERWPRLGRLNMYGKKPLFNNERVRQ